MRKKRNYLLAAMMAGVLMAGARATAEAGTPEMDAMDFVSLAEAVPDVILEIRYYSTYNFVGDRIDGYEEPCALLTKEAAEALKGAAEDAQEQIGNRNTLRDIVVENGFKPLDTEWWHFTLENEPYPDTYFAFPVKEESVPGNTENMVQCEFCGGWYEEGNVFRNHICPGRDEVYAPEESD